MRDTIVYKITINSKVKIISYKFNNHCIRAIWTHIADNINLYKLKSGETTQITITRVR